MLYEGLLRFNPASGGSALHVDITGQRVAFSTASGGGYRLSAQEWRCLWALGGRHIQEGETVVTEKEGYEGIAGPLRQYSSGRRICCEGVQCSGIQSL